MPRRSSSETQLLNCQRGLRHRRRPPVMGPNSAVRQRVPHSTDAGCSGRLMSEAEHLATRSGQRLHHKFGQAKRFIGVSDEHLTEKV